MRKGTSGFTIVELLVVIVVVAILAAISTVAYTGIQNRAHDTAITSNLSNLKKQLDIYVINENKTPDYDQLVDATNGVMVAKNSYAVLPATTFNLTICWTTVEPEYAIIALSKSGKMFKVTHESSATEFEADWTSVDTACDDAIVDYNFGHNYRGYASDTTPQWRSWVGGE